MVHWVYALQSSNSSDIYVGETTRLYRRWNEHATGRGGVTTSRDNYDTLIGLYNVSHNVHFLRCFQTGSYDRYINYQWDYDLDKHSALEIENLITERYNHEQKNVKGGKYCRDSCTFGKAIIDRPLCNCGYICEVNMTKDKSKMFFVCPVPEWTNTFYGIETPEHCSFWKEYTQYRTLRDQYELDNRKEYAIQKRKENLSAFIEATKDD